MITEIKVDNLKCHGCANTISSSIEKLNGVEMVEVDVDTSNVMISHSEGIGKETFIKKIASLGYPEEGTSNTLQKAQSYVSCAIGRLA